MAKGRNKAASELQTAELELIQRRVAQAESEEQKRIANIVYSRVEITFEGGDARSLTWSPDGRTLVLVTARTLVRFDLLTASARTLALRGVRAIAFMMIASSSKAISSFSSRGRAKLPLTQAKSRNKYTASTTT